MILAKPLAESFHDAFHSVFTTAFGEGGEQYVGRRGTG